MSITSSLSNKNEISDVENILDNNKQSASLQPVKHPLEHTWSYWLNTNMSKNWMTNLVELSSFDTVEDYWCLYHYMKVPSELLQGQDYMVFKKGIKPTWEDPVNNKGGRWIICESKSKVFLDPLWSDLVLLMIGENFEHSDEICGAVVNLKIKSKVALWTRGADKQRNMEIGIALKKMLGVKNNIHFYKHNTTISKYSV